MKVKLRRLLVAGAITGSLGVASIAPAGAAPPAPKNIPNSCVAGVATSFSPTWVFDGQVLNFGAFARFFAQNPAPDRNLGEGVSREAHVDSGACVDELMPG